MSKAQYYIKCSDISVTNKIDNLTCVIIHEISHVSIIMKRIRVLRYCMYSQVGWQIHIDKRINIHYLQHCISAIFLWDNRRIFYIINRIHGCLEI